MLRSEDTWAFVARLKQDAAHRQTFRSWWSAPSKIERKGFHLGVDRYLCKPIERSDLIRELRALTGQPPLFQVLIIDDEERDRYLLKQRFRDLPVLIAEASSGAEGIRAACKHKPDLIFLDLGMPDLTGFEVLERLKSEAAAGGYPGRSGHLASAHPCERESTDRREQLQL